MTPDTSTCEDVPCAYANLTTPGHAVTARATGAALPATATASDARATGMANQSLVNCSARLYRANVMEVVGSEPEADLICSILPDAGIKCMHRITNAGTGAMDGMAIGGVQALLIPSHLAK